MYIYCMFVNQKSHSMKEIFAHRVKSARKMAGFSQQNLADKLNNIISKQAISKYEKGEMLPDSQVLLNLADVLNVKPDYFFRKPVVNLSEIEFRKKSKLSIKEENSIKEKTIDFLERYLELENLLGIDEPFKIPVKNKIISSHEHIENVTVDLRNAWDLGLNPVPNVLEMLEDRGVKVFELNTSDNFDGFSSNVKGIPVIVLNKKLDPIRKRFTALHELGHLILKFDENKEHHSREKLCHSFAGAFLIPKPIFFREFSEHRTSISLPELIAVKEYFGISVQALMMRAKVLNVISESRLTNFFIYVRKNRLQNEETWGEYTGKEKSGRYHQLVFQAASEQIITISKAAELENITVSEFRGEFEKAS